VENTTVDRSFYVRYHDHTVTVFDHSFLTVHDRSPLLGRDRSGPVKNGRVT
jgi:hypothetical protein